MKRIKNHNRKETRIVTREEEAKIVVLLRSAEHCKVRSYYSDVADLVEVLVDTGIRLGEALVMRDEDICLKTSMITVHVTKGNPRRVPMTSRVATILERRLEPEQERLFNLTEVQIRLAWSWVKAQIGIADSDRLVLHSLRKACAQRLVEAGVYMGIVYEWLGHPTMRHEHGLARLPLRKLTEAAKLLEQYNQSNHQ
jgi:integrase